MAAKWNLHIHSSLPLNIRCWGDTNEEGYCLWGLLGSFLVETELTRPVIRSDGVLFRVLRPDSDHQCQSIFLSLFRFCPCIGWTWHKYTFSTVSWGWEVPGHGRLWKYDPVLNKKSSFGNKCSIRKATSKFNWYNLERESTGTLWEFEAKTKRCLS